MSKYQIHVYKNKKDNTWYATRAHYKRTIFRSKTKHECIGKAIHQAKREGNTEVIIHSNNIINED